MIPTMTPDVKDLSNEALAKTIRDISYQFCIKLDLTDEYAVQKHFAKMDYYVHESTLRVIEGLVGYRPESRYLMFQALESEFTATQPQYNYNIKRLLSASKRYVFTRLNHDNVKYIKWLKYRIKYGTEALSRSLRAPKKPNSGDVSLQVHHEYEPMALCV